MDYQEIRWLFNGRPSTGHVYDLMQLVGQEEGFDYELMDSKNNRLKVNLDAVNDQQLIHAAKERDR